jgi:hypothetical protein
MIVFMLNNTGYQAIKTSVFITKSLTILNSNRRISINIFTNIRILRQPSLKPIPLLYHFALIKVRLKPFNFLFSWIKILIIAKGVVSITNIRSAFPTCGAANPTPLAWFRTYLQSFLSSQETLQLFSATFLKTGSP